MSSVSPASLGVGLSKPVLIDLPLPDPLDLHVAQPTPAVAPTDDLDRAIVKARAALLAKQDERGFWCAELQGDSILESEYILMKFILSQDDDPELPLIANYLRRLQQPDGGWNMYPGGKADLSGTVKAYFALKLTGDRPDAPHMVKARDLIRAMGGAERCNTFTKFFFACLGQIPFDACPSIPPEIVLLPKWFYFNLYHVSAWTRTMILPLGIVTTMKFKRDLPPEKGMQELYVDRDAARRLAEPVRGLPTNWRQFFLRVDQFLKRYEEMPIESLRARAMRQAERWLLEHLDGSEGLGAIFPPMVYILIVFRALGYGDDHPRVKIAHKHLHDFFIRDVAQPPSAVSAEPNELQPGAAVPQEEIRIQPCLSPVWDTGIALHALAESGLTPETEAAQRSTRWLLDKECKFASDWKRNCPDGEVAGWFFEFENPHYPDVDDTAMVSMALKRTGGQAASAAAQRGINWLLAMQNTDGGWAAFDKTKDRPILEKIPFADHNAMQDPSCPDITGRVLECLGHFGFTTDSPVVRRAISYLQKQQDASGGWWGRWGVNYVYGTWQVLTGLRAVGEDMSRDYIRAADTWLRSVQKPDGSFGESCDSYEDPSLKGIGASTPSQTAWGAMGLMAVAGERTRDDAAIRRGIDWLIEHQQTDGDWREEFYTGTGFPKVFYLRYHLYRLYFPLTALARYRRLTAPI